MAAVVAGLSLLAAATPAPVAFTLKEGINIIVRTGNENFLLFTCVIPDLCIRLADLHGEALLPRVRVDDLVHGGAVSDGAEEGIIAALPPAGRHPSLH